MGDLAAELSDEGFESLDPREKGGFGGGFWFLDAEASPQAEDVVLGDSESELFRRVGGELSVAHLAREVFEAEKVAKFEGFGEGEFIYSWNCHEVALSLSNRPPQGGV